MSPSIHGKCRSTRMQAINRRWLCQKVLGAQKANCVDRPIDTIFIKHGRTRVQKSHSRRLADFTMYLLAGLRRRGGREWGREWEWWWLVVGRQVSCFNVTPSQPFRSYLGGRAKHNASNHKSRSCHSSRHFAQPSLCLVIREALEKMKLNAPGRQTLAGLEALAVQLNCQKLDSTKVNHRRRKIKHPNECQEKENRSQTFHRICFLFLFFNFIHLLSLSGNSGKSQTGRQYWEAVLSQ